jgi:RNA polymerase sigma-70 factor (ECF subfamily)
MVAVHLDDRLSHRLDPSDVVEEALLKAAQRLPSYAASRPVAFYPWLRGIAWDVLVKIHRDHLAAQKRAVAKERSWQPSLPDESISDLAAHLVGPTSSPSCQAVRREVLNRVREAVARLSPDDREVIVLRYLEQLPVREIAQVLHMTESAVRGRQFRAIQKLHEWLADLK